MKGKEVVVDVSVAGGIVNSCREKEVFFQLVDITKSHATAPMVAMTSERIGTPFGPVSADPKKFEHLKDLKFTEVYPNSRPRPFQLLIAEPYYSALMVAEQRSTGNPAVPVAKRTSLGWVLRGASSEGTKVASLYHARVLEREKQHESFEIESIYESISFNLPQFWSGENVGINPNESMDSNLTVEIQADQHQQSTAKHDSNSKSWSVELP